MSARRGARGVVGRALVLVAVCLGACGGRPRLVVELGAPIERTEERSTGFEPELIEDNGDATFAGVRLASPTANVAYDGIEVLVAGERIWSLDASIHADLLVLDGVVVEVGLYTASHPDAAPLEPLGRDVTARFDAWRDKDPAHWPYVARDLRAAAGAKEFGGVGGQAGRFVHASGVEATIRARASVGPNGTAYWLAIKLTAPPTRE